MFHYVEARVLTAGINGKAKALAKLPIHVFATDTGIEAIECLKSSGAIDALVSRWDLPDMKDGELIRRLKCARPWIPTLVLLDEPYDRREALVRELGVVAVLPSDVHQAQFQEVIAQMLGLRAVTISGRRAPVSSCCRQANGYKKAKGANRLLHFPPPSSWV